MAGKSVVVAILADTKKFNSGMDEAGRKGKGFGGVLGGIGKLAVAGLAAAGTAAVGFIALSVRAAAAAQKVSAQTEAVLTSTGSAAGKSAAQISKLAGQLSILSGVDDEVIQSGENVLLTFTKIKGTNFDRATEAALNLSVAMGTDMKSASMLVGKALNDPIKGMAALARAGVQLTAQQKAQVTQMVAVGDVAGAQALLLEELSTQFGGSAEAFGRTFSGALGRVQTIFGNLQESVGGALLPMLTAVLNRVADFLGLIQQSAAFNAFIANMTNFANGILDGTTKLSDIGGVITRGIKTAADWLAGGGIASIVQALVSGRSALVDAGMQVFPAIVEALVAVVPQLATGAVTLVTSLVSLLVSSLPILVSGAMQLFLGIAQGMVKVLPNLITQIVALIPVLVDAIVGMVPTLLNGAISLFSALIDAVVTILPMLISQIVAMLPGLITAIIGLIPKLITGAISLFMALVNAIPVVLPILIQALADMIPVLIETVIGLIPILLDAGIQLMLALVEAIPIIIPALIGAVISLVPAIGNALVKAGPQLLAAGVKLFGSITSAFGQIGPKLLKIGGQIVQGLWDGISKAWAGFLKWWGDRVGAVVNTVRDFLGIHSPSRVFATIGVNILRGLEKGLRSSNSISSIMSGLSSDVASGFDARIDAPAGYRSGSGGNTYVIRLPVGMPSAAAGREIVQAIEEYERFGGTVRIGAA